jgi:hypothetical protein
MGEAVDTTVRKAMGEAVGGTVGTTVKGAAIKVAGVARSPCPEPKYRPVADASAPIDKKRSTYIRYKYFCGGFFCSTTTRGSFSSRGASLLSVVKAIIFDDDERGLIREVGQRGITRLKYNYLNSK